MNEPEKTNQEVKTSVETESAASGNQTTSSTDVSVERDSSQDRTEDLSDGVKDSQVNVSIDQHFTGNPADTSHKNVEAAQPVTDPLV